MKRATTAVPAVLDAPTCDYRNSARGRLTVPRDLVHPRRTFAARRGIVMSSVCQRMAKGLH